MSENVVTIQKTSKRYKASGCLGWVMIIFGIFLVFPAMENMELGGSTFMIVTGSLMILIGLALKIYAAVGKWWNND